MIDIIAEVGLNHCGDYNIAKKYVNYLCKIDDVQAISFQVREKSFYINKYKSYALKNEQYKNIAEKIRKSGKRFGLAICDDELENFPRPDFVKILSKDIENKNLINKILNYWSGIPIYISTGLSDFDTISNTLFSIDCDNVFLIHTRLSNEIEDVNLNAIINLKDRFGSKICFGNHCKNHTVLYAATTFKPKAIFFYVKESDKKQCPDYIHAISLNKVKNICYNIREVEKSLGDGIKKNSQNILQRFI